ncbi:hypothetical protein [Streptomyces sp. ZS0098]|uniref:hypothetical protein n=1 Tax=Streptomyces sp. ZS0098 TaxID=1904044 RepID=UPI00217D4C1B|nr:hypothetical protein [Streptomyces sp. ZS0098]
MRSSNPSHTGDRQKIVHSRHPTDDRPHHPHGDRRLLRVILAVPVVLLTVVSALFLWLAINTRPDGDWDQAAYGGIELGSAFAVVSAGAVGACGAASGAGEPFLPRSHGPGSDRWRARSNGWLWLSTSAWSAVTRSQ